MIFQAETHAVFFGSATVFSQIFLYSFAHALQRIIDWLIFFPFLIAWSICIRYDKGCNDTLHIHFEHIYRFHVNFRLSNSMHRRKAKGFHLTSKLDIGKSPRLCIESCTSVCQLMDSSCPLSTSRMSKLLLFRMHSIIYIIIYRYRSYPNPYYITEQGSQSCMADGSSFN